MDLTATEIEEHVRLAIEILADVRADEDEDDEVRRFTDLGLPRIAAEKLKALVPLRSAEVNVVCKALDAGVDVEGGRYSGPFILRLSAEEWLAGESRIQVLRRRVRGWRGSWREAAAAAAAGERERRSPGA